MPYELSFIKRVEAPDQYVNTCCYGGDVVAEQLLPTVRQRYSAIQHNQEDWGWFIWFRSGDVRLAIDIFCDDPARGSFRIHLTSRRPRLFLRDLITDTPELDELRGLVVADLTRWVGTAPHVVAVDNEYRAKSGAA